MLSDEDTDEIVDIIVLEVSILEVRLLVEFVVALEVSTLIYKDLISGLLEFISVPLLNSHFIAI